MLNASGLKLLKKGVVCMNRSEVSFSSLSNNQIEEVKALETKFNTSRTGQEVVLIAYTKPEQK